MKEAKVNAQMARLKKAYRKTSTTASFILLNGLVLAAITYCVLFFTAMDVREQEARSMTRDLVSLTEQSLTDVEKTVRGLGYYYSSMAGENVQGAPTQYNVQRVLAGDKRFSAILYATDKGVWQYADLAANKLYTQYNPAAGWPGYAELYRATYAQSVNTLSYLTNPQWPALKVKNGQGGQQTMAVTYKMKQADGSTGILVALTRPSNLFAADMLAQRPDILRVSVTDPLTKADVLDYHNGASDQVSAANLEIGYPLQSGDKYWEIRYGMLPPPAVKIMGWSPWLALGFIIFLTVSAAFTFDRKHFQDQKLAELSKNLAGAHHDLQTSLSERDKLFHALRKSEREHRALINSVSDLIFETDETGKILFLNETWKRVTNTEISEGIGQSLFAMIEPSERTQQRDMFEELVRGERQAYRTEARLDVGNGVLKPVEIAFSMLRMGEDKSLRVVGTITDIEKRRRAEAAMREAEQRFRAMFENSISGIYQSSVDGRYISANPAMAEILGYDTSEELMDRINDIATDVYLRPEENKAFNQRMLFEGRVSGVETEVKRKDGKRIWIMENARVVRNEKGAIQCYEGSITDITERKMAEEAMHNARLQAEMSSRSRMEFLANMSHELRTPLNAVIGFSEIIKDEVMGPHSIPVYKEYAQDIYDSGNYLLKVISEILEVSKIETGNRELNVSTFRLQRALKSCMTIMSGRVEESGVKIVNNIPEALPELMAEELGFKQIMLNLIGNAIKFTSEGGTVTVSAELGEKGEMIIDIADTGIGMAPDEITKALQPFAKVDNNFSTMKAGTGLGLTIVDSLVRLHGGEFQLISEKGIGTTARVIMPAQRVFHVADSGQPPALSIVS